MKPAEELARWLSEWRLPESTITWLDLLEQTTLEAGADLDDVLLGRRMPAAARARHHAWGALRAAGYSYLTIAGVWGMNHTSVIYGVRRITKWLEASQKEQRRGAADDRAAAAA